MAAVQPTLSANEAPSLPEGNSGLAPVKDRLITTLFLAALFHAIVIIGVTFVAPPSPQGIAPTLDVVMLTNESPSEAANPNAAYLAQRNQQGNGNVRDQIQPTNPAASPLAAANEGSAAGNGTEFKQTMAGAQTVEILSSRAERAAIRFQSGVDAPAHAAETPLALTPTPPNPISTSKIDKELQLRGEQTKELYVTPDTRESRLAPYLSVWKRKIEKIGTLNYPLEARRKSRAKNPVLEVVIRADGSLADAMVRESSGDKAIDQAALNILRLGAPFDPFPEALRQNYQQLRFAYEWQFLDRRR